MGPGSFRKDKIILALDLFSYFFLPPFLYYFLKNKTLGVKIEILGMQKLNSFVNFRIARTQKQLTELKKVFISSATDNFVIVILYILIQNFLHSPPESYEFKARR